MAKILILNGSSLSETEAREYPGRAAVYQTLNWNAPVPTQERLYSHCLLLLDFEDYKGGPMAAQLRFLHDNRGVKHWIVAFRGVSGAFGGALDKWRSLANGLHAGMTVLYEHPKLPELREQVQEYLQKDPSKCLIGYYSRRACAEQAAALFSETLTDWEFEAVPGSDLSEQIKSAGKLILVGQDEREFQFAPLPVDTRKDLLLYLDCQGPLFQDYYGYRVDEMLAVLRSFGWTFPVLPRYAVGNLQYEWWRVVRSRLKEGEPDSHCLTVWDEYGMPCLHQDYTSENIDRFLSSFDSVETVWRWLAPA